MVNETASAGEYLLHNDCCRDKSNSDASNCTTHNQQVYTLSYDLKHNTNNIDNASSDDCASSPKPVCKIPSDQGANKCSRREDRNNDRFLPRLVQIPHISLWVVYPSRMAEILLELLHSEDATDVAGVISEEDSAERCVSANHDDLPGDGRQLICWRT